MRDPPRRARRDRRFPVVVSTAVGPLRTDLLRRLVAATLIATLGMTLVPVAGAQGGASSLSAMLNDADAFEQALAAAHAAEPGTDPLDVFAEAYAAAVGDLSAEAVAHLLGRSSLGGVLPPVHDEALAAAKAQAPPTISAASLARSIDAPVPPIRSHVVTTDAPQVTLREQAPSTRPRAP